MDLLRFANMDLYSIFGNILLSWSHRSFYLLIVHYSKRKFDFGLILLCSIFIYRDWNKPMWRRLDRIFLNDVRLVNINVEKKEKKNLVFHEQYWMVTNDLFRKTSDWTVFCLKLSSENRKANRLILFCVAVCVCVI